MEVFSTGWTWQVHREWLDQEERPRLQWWALTVQVRGKVAWGCGATPRAARLLSRR